jgi:hypothetical protein
MVELADEQTNRPLTTLTYRLPPKRVPKGTTDEKQQDKIRWYVTHLENIFRKVEPEGASRFEDIAEVLDRTMEIDTINSDKALRGGGTRILYEALKRVREEERENAPEWVFYYRYGSLQVVEPRLPTQGGRTRGFILPDNNSSSGLFTKCGFGNYGKLRDPNEVVVRKIPNIAEPVVLRPTWVFGLTSFETALKMSEKRYRQHVLGEEA